MSRRTQQAACAVTETLRRMARMPRFHAWLGEQLRPYLGRRIVEVGCGTGTLTRHLLESGATVAGVDVEEEYLEACRRAWEPTGRFQAFRADVETDAFLELGAFAPDTVVCSNVLEHLEQDRRAVVNMAAVLSPGGVIVLVAPAFQGAYGRMDRELGHRRRYSLGQVEGLLEEAGMVKVAARYFNFAGLVGWLVHGRGLRCRLLPAPQLRLFDALVPLFRLLDPPLKMVAGQSIIMVGRKSEAVSGA